MRHLNHNVNGKNLFRALFFQVLLMLNVLLLIAFPGREVWAEAILKGKVTSEQGEPLAFANVYLQGTTEGTTTNKAGRYKLKLPADEYTVVFQFMGHQQKSKTISLEEGEQRTLNVTLSKRAYETEAVTVTGKDPAYRIIKNAIEHRDKYRKAVKSYECKLYTKGTIKLDSAKESAMVDSGQLPPGYVYFSETVSELKYRYPDNYNEKVKSSKVSGRDDAVSLNFALNSPVIFYEDLVEFDGSTQRPIVSPIADNALNYYEYQLQNTYSDKGQKVHRIQVKPKRPNDPVFAGTIHIVAESWRIHSLDFTLTTANGLQTFDTLEVNQTYLPINDSVWRLYNQNFRIRGSILGLDLKGRALAQFTDYQLNPSWSESPFDNAIIEIPEASIDQDSAYWEEIRPFELTEEEKQDYNLKDSLKKVRSQPSYIDSVDSANNQPSFGGIFLTGYNYRRRTKNIEIEAPSLLQSLLNFNTVEGFGPRLRFNITKTVEEKPDWEFSPFVRYGVANDQLNGGLSVERNPWFMEGGRNVFQFQSPPPITPTLNTSYTLFDGKNFAKFYQKAYIKAQYKGDEWGNGWFPSLSLSYEERQPLTNSTSYTLADNQSYTNNIPDHPFFSEIPLPPFQTNFQQHQAFTIEGQIRFKPGLKYMMIKGDKVNLGTPYPTLSLNYRKAIDGIAGSDAAYDYVQFGLNGDADFKLIGKLNYRASAGKFLNQGRVPFMDYKHFQGQEVIYQLQSARDFQLLDYYEASTTDPFAEGHFQHDFSGFIWNKIPLARKLQWQVLGTGNVLYKEDRTYWEWGIGLTRLFNFPGGDLFSVHFFQAYNDDQFVKRGFRIGLDSPIQF